MTQENKDAQYKEEARIALIESRDGLSIEDAYLAGRKRGEKEKLLNEEASKLVIDRYIVMYESLKKEIEELKGDSGEYKKRWETCEVEIERLKREVEIANGPKKNYTDRLSWLSGRDLVKENQKLRELIERATPWVKNAKTITPRAIESIEQWHKEASEAVK